MENQPTFYNRLMLDERHPDYEPPEKDDKKKDDEANYDTYSK